jgi:hypothetical protein
MSFSAKVLLDPASRRAVRSLAAELGVSMSEVVRRALVHYRRHMRSARDDSRRRRVAALERAFDLFRSVDARSEVRRLKQEDRYS